jgi:hypothetical protein
MTIVGRVALIGALALLVAGCGGAGSPVDQETISHGSAAALGGSDGGRGAAAFLTPTGDNSIVEYGSEADTATKRRAEGALKAYLDAREKGNWPKACSYLGAVPQRQLEILASTPTHRVRRCTEAYSILTREAPVRERANPLNDSIAAFRVEGPRGFALFYGFNSQKLMIPMREEGGSWKANQVAPVAYPIGSTGR